MNFFCDCLVENIEKYFSLWLQLMIWNPRIIKLAYSLYILDVYA